MIKWYRFINLYDIYFPGDDILNEFVSISLCANAFRKGMYPAITISYSYG